MTLTAATRPAPVDQLATTAEELCAAAAAALPLPHARPRTVDWDTAATALRQASQASAAAASAYRAAGDTDWADYWQREADVARRAAHQCAAAAALNAVGWLR